MLSYDLLLFGDQFDCFDRHESGGGHRQACSLNLFEARTERDEPTATTTGDGLGGEGDGFPWSGDVEEHAVGRVGHVKS